MIYWNRVACISVIIFSGGLSFYKSLYAYPFCFYRLVSQDGKKVIDFIGDRHFEIMHKVKRASRGTSLSILSEREKELFTSTERTLLKTLRELAREKRQSPIHLLWESDEEADKRIMNIGSTVFITYAGIALKKEFAAKKYKNIIFVLADAYRTNREPFVCLYTSYVLARFKEHCQKILENTKVYDAFAFIRNVIEDKNHAAYQDLAKIENQKTQNNLMIEWQKYTELLKNFYDRSIKNNEALTLQQFTQLPKYNDFINEFTQYCTLSIMNYELLFKLLNSKIEYGIVYAGARHCDDVVSLLTQNYNFNMIMHLGANSHTKNYNVTLSPIIWKFLKENFSQKTNIKNIHNFVITDEDIKRFFDAVMSNDQVGVINNLKKGHAAYVDLVNAQEKITGEVALYKAVQYNLFEMIKLLLENGAYTNIADNNGETPLHAAVYVGDTEIIELLLNKGADPEQKNKEGKSAFDIAQEGVIKELIQTYLKQAKRK